MGGFEPPTFALSEQYSNQTKLHGYKLVPAPGIAPSLRESEAPVRSITPYRLVLVVLLLDTFLSYMPNLHNHMLMDIWNT